MKATVWRHSLRDSDESNAIHEVECDHFHMNGFALVFVRDGAPFLYVKTWDYVEVEGAAPKETKP